MNIRLVSLNVRGFGTSARQEAIFEDLKINGSDIFFLQECYFKQPPKPPDWVVDYAWSACGDNRNARVGILVANRNVRVTCRFGTREIADG